MKNRLIRRVPAPCRLDPDAWFPEGVIGQAALAQMKAAKAVCWSQCTIRERCLEIAMKAEGVDSIKQRAGVYGGLTPTERVELGRTRLAAARTELAA